jgi:hypothetical protein
MNRRRFLAGSGAVLVAAPAAAAPLPVPPGGQIGFKVLRNGAPIGEHHLTFVQNGDDLAVSINADLDVRMLGLSVFTYQIAATERWSAGSFAGLDSHVNHNGTKLEVHAHPIPGGFHVDATKAGSYDYTGTPAMLPLTYWNRAFLGAEILNVETGHHYPAIVNSPGWYRLPTAEGGMLVAQRFDVTGKLHLSVWYDQFDQWSGLEFNVDGDISFQKIVS